ncbi:ABC transporter ATP-binding protein [Actinoallomurus acanthiterrae]
MTGEVVLEGRELMKHFTAARSRRRGVLGRRPPIRAVEDVSLALRAGSVTALVGESGSGKSTVARLLAQVYPPTSGEVVLRGDPVGASGGSRSREFRRDVQLVFQDPFASLNPFHRVRYHLARPLRIHGHARSSAEAAEQAETLLERVSLTPVGQFMDKLPHELSGGQRQRVAIARALAARPTVLIADEPVSMLDVSIRLGVLRLLEQLVRADDLALLYITHDIATARYFADEIMVMYAGRIVERGPGEEVTQAPAHPYTRLLVASSPDPGRPSTEDPRPGAHGEPPNPIAPPDGCRFHPRCPVALPICAERVPHRTDLGDERWVHCWNHDEEAATR